MLVANTFHCERNSSRNHTGAKSVVEPQGALWSTMSFSRIPSTQKSVKPRIVAVVVAGTVAHTTKFTQALLESVRDRVSEYMLEIFL